ncbi:OstA-like protein [Urechidicola vernalis]|uniref:OstA-like protein n=1 Tax=Urechidicola vernalis TaxID=3075600 RepID=A0ABU2Y4N6_9FLAO|nr:OstA-like protein [Urechidicola sp. P050]MDT0552028.1 OstA-like protein [Urechidicola sp. P050]
MLDLFPEETPFMKRYILLLLLCFSVTVFAQKTTKLNVINADFTYPDKNNPDATVSTGNVFVEINGATIQCERVVLNKKTNFLEAMGNVVLNQGDSVHQTSDFANYDGNKKFATSWGNVVLKDPTMTLTTDKLNFDRAKQHLFYGNYGTIKDSINVLNSKQGNYYLDAKRFQAFTNVTVVNPDQTLETDHLEYFTETGKAYLYKPSTITGDDSVVYTEKGFHNTKTKISHLTKNSWIKYEDRLIEGDSLFYNEATSFSSATGNIKITDTINNSILKGGYGEFFRTLDSAFVIQKAQAISLIENDSLYIHGDTLLVTGKSDNRIVRAYHHVKIFKEDLQGKCDSLVSVQASGLTKMFRKPILWAEESQLTGDVIHFLSNSETEQLDSLKILGNAFMIQIDSAGFNQTKGRKILGKFKENDLRIIDVLGNAETLQYVRNDKQELIGIDKTRASNIHITLEKNNIKTIGYIGKPDGKIYPEEEIHVNDRKFKGFHWRESERPTSKEEIFIHDPGDELMIQKDRIREREEKQKALRDGEKKRKQELEMKAMIQKQDSLSNLEKNKIKN